MGGLVCIRSYMSMPTHIGDSHDSAGSGLRRDATPRVERAGMRTRGVRMGGHAGGVSDPAVRLLRLLTLLQEHATWTGPQLAKRLDVSVRGVRRDVERLRELGYPVRSERGAGGGYQLAAGKAMPPLVLDDDEAVAVAVSLSTAAGGTVEGVAQASVRALAKLDQVVPARLRERIADLREATVSLGARTAPVDQGILTGLARACRDHVQVRLAYTKADGSSSERRLEPYRLVATGRRWYLLGFDLDREDWRVFRLDRMADLHVSTFRFTPREAPDAADRVLSGITRDAYRWQATVRLHASAEQVRDQVPPSIGRIEPDGDDACLLFVGADHLGYLALHLAVLGHPMDVLDPPELRDEMAQLAARLHDAAHPGGADAAVAGPPDR